MSIRASHSTFMGTQQFHPVQLSLPPVQIRHSRSDDKLEGKPAGPPKDPRVIDLSGKIQQLSLPFPEQLQVLDLSENDFECVKFVFRVKAPNLETLRMNSCRIVELPEASPVFFDTLKCFSLEGNEIERVPDWLLEMPEIQELSLFGNRIKSLDVPPMVSQLRALNLSYNPLEEITSCGGACIQMLNVAHTKMREIPDTEKLGCRSLIMGKCQIEGVLDTVLLGDLALLDLNGNKITGIGERFWESCGKLVGLNLANNMIEVLPNNLPTPHHISRLVLTGNRLRELPECLMDSKALEVFNVSKNRLTAIPPFKFPQLREFIVAFNELKEIPDSFNGCNYLNTLNVGGNKLTDLPPSLGSCRRIMDVNCHSNEMIRIPPVCMSFPSVKNLTLSNNKLTTLTDSIGVLFMIRVFDISNNHITEFPSFVSNYSEMRHFNISHNRISSIPADFVFPARLHSLDVSFNLLTEWTKPLPDTVRLLNLSYNPMTTVGSLSCLSGLRYLSVAGDTTLEGELDITESCRASIELFGTKATLPEKNAFVQREGVVSSTDGFTRSFGIATTLGTRPTMEDSVIAIGGVKSSVFAVFDGHAGSRASHLASEYLKDNIDEFDEELDPAEMAARIIKHFAKLNGYLSEQRVTDGTTVAFVLLKGDVGFSTGIGDSRVLRVFKEGAEAEFEQLTTDHKVTDGNEFDRLKTIGHSVCSDCRIQKKLAVSRSLGDFWACDDGIFVEPDVTMFGIGEADKGLVIACDGLWDVIDSHTASCVTRSAKTATDAAVTLKNMALAAGSTDNISIVVVDFQPSPGDEGFCCRNTVEELPPYKEPEQPALVRSPATPGRGRRRR